MNYRHIYHAGSFTDVFKHIVLVSLIEYMKNKPNPFCYLDTHAGIGSYTLNSVESQKTLEYQTGIRKIYDEKNAPALIERFLQIVRDCNHDFDQLSIYPGSPLIARHLLREEDKAILCELHPEDYQLLKHTFYKDPQVAIHLQDGHAGIKAYLPPKQKRGLVLIDPPYEKENEMQMLLKTVETALHQWPTGMYAIWYPIKKSLATKLFLRDMKPLCIGKNVLDIQLTIYQADSPQSLNGSGMLIINPPWQLDQTLDEPLSWLWKQLAIDKKSYYRMEWLNKV